MKRQFVAVLALCLASGCGTPFWTPRAPALSDAPVPQGLAAANAVYSVVLDSLTATSKQSHLLVSGSTATEVASPGERPVPIASGFDTRIPVLLVRPGTQLRDYRDAEGVFSFSAVRFDADSTHAMVTVAWRCGPLCGAGFDYSLARKPGRAWVVTRTVGLWRS
jgi:hypothetical protein